MKASVIISTYNRAPFLERVLRTLVEQTEPMDSFEIIVVDDHSGDDTPQVCKRLQNCFLNFRYIRLTRKSGTASARNAGIDSARAKHILFIDDDCIPERDWIANMRIALGKYPIVAGAITSASSPYFLLCHNISEFHGVMFGRKTAFVDFIAGANMGFQHYVLDALNGFWPQSKHAEDMEIILRARSQGYRIFFAPNAKVVHDPPGRRTLAEIVQYSVRHAEITVHLRNRYRELLQTPLILRSSLLTLLFSPIIASAVTLQMYCRNKTIRKWPWTMPLVFILKLSWCWGAARGIKEQTMAGE